MGKIHEQDRQFFEVLMMSLKSTGGKPSASGGLSYDSELADKLRDAYDTIARLEGKNHNLLEIIQNLKDTYEFFEISNDMGILYGHKSVGLRAA
jgi:hypothetical protein